MCLIEPSHFDRFAILPRIDVYIVIDGFWGGGSGDKHAISNSQVKISQTNAQWVYDGYSAVLRNR